MRRWLFAVNSVGLRVGLRVGLLLGLMLLAGCESAAYLAQQGAGQWHILRARTRITEVLADPAVSDDTKRRLRLAKEAREFGVTVLGLRGGDSYTRFLDTHGAPVAYNLTAAPKTRLVPYVHHFPIVGAVPYLGFFREADARRAEKKLIARGFDTYLRPVSGYSTLGLTSDPIYSSMLEGGDAEIVEVVLHEMLHGTVYLRGQSDWDESLATFVGLHGAAAFFAARGSSDESASLFLAAKDEELRETKFAHFLAPVVAALEALYARPISDEDKVKLREAVFEQARQTYLAVFPPPPGYAPGSFARGPINNALIVSYAVYHRSTDDHRRLYEKLGGDLRRMIHVGVDAAENEHNPINYLKKL